MEDQKLMDRLSDEIFNRISAADQSGMLRSCKYGVSPSNLLSELAWIKLTFSGNLSDFISLVEELGFKVVPALKKDGSAHKSAQVIIL